MKTFAGKTIVREVQFFDNLTLRSLVPILKSCSKISSVVPSISSRRFSVTPRLTRLTSMEIALIGDPTIILCKIKLPSDFFDSEEPNET